MLAPRPLLLPLPAWADFVIAATLVPWTTCIAATIVLGDSSTSAIALKERPVRPSR